MNFPVDKNRFKKILSDRGLKQRWVAEQIGFTGQTGHVQFSRIVNGEKPFPSDRINNVADLLGLSPDDVRDIFGMGA